MSGETDRKDDDWLGEDLYDGSETDDTDEDQVAEESSDGSDEEETSRDHSRSGLSWETVRHGYANSEIDVRSVRQQTVELLCNDYNLISAPETSELFWYDESKGYYRDDGEQFISETLEAELGKYNSRRETNQIIWKTEHRKTIEKDDFGPAGVVCLENGVLDVTDPSNPALKGHDSQYLFERQWPVSYDPSAECPRFKHFLKENVAADDLKKLQEFVGYTVIHHWGQPYKKALLLLGPTDSGKSTFLNVVEALLGKENVANESFTDLVDGNFATAQLAGKLANIYADVDSKLVKDIGLFKSLTGNDRLSASKKYQSKFTFRPTQKLLFAANDVPNIENEDDAFYNRWLHVRFPERVPDDEQDKQLEQKLVEEIPGIFNWALEGYRRLKENGGFTNERTIAEKRSFWRSYTDSVERFVENGPVNLQVDAETPKDEIYAAYQVWSEERDYPVKAKQTLSKRLKQKYDVETCYVTIYGERVRCYRGITTAGDTKSETEETSDHGWGIDEL